MATAGCGEGDEDVSLRGVVIGKRNIPKEEITRKEKLIGRARMGPEYTGKEELLRHKYIQSPDSKEDKKGVELETQHLELTTLLGGLDKAESFLLYF